MSKSTKEEHDELRDRLCNKNKNKKNDFIHKELIDKKRVCKKRLDEILMTKELDEIEQEYIDNYYG